MTELSDLADVLPEGTSEAWELIAPVVPTGAYLAGGTALAVHLHHRVSRDLDFFVSEPFDAYELADTLEAIGPFAATDIQAGTLNGVMGRTKVQFLDARTQYPVAETTTFAGVEIAAVMDLLATKLKVIGDRGELRDYFDVMKIEQMTDLTVEQGIGLYVDRYRPRPPEMTVRHIVAALGYLDDVGEDPYLEGIAERSQIENYWRRRQPQIARHLATYGVPGLPGD